MREKMCREVTVDKYTEFLKSVKINGDNPHIDLFGLIANYEINKSVAKALFDLAILDGDYKIWEWLSFEVDKKLSLTVLNYLLERSKKSRAVIIPGMEETNAILKALAQQFSDYIGKREHSYKTHPIGLKAETLFSEQDSKQGLINKAAFAIATGVYEKYGLAEQHNIHDISSRNSRIVFAAKDLVTQLLK